MSRAAPQAAEPPGSASLRIATLPNRAAALAAAAALVPAIRARAKRTESDRCVPVETIEEIAASGLFNLVTPRLFGGSELGLAALVEVTAELSAACGSTGWVYGVLAGHSWLLNLFPIEAQREVFSDSRALIATVFRLGAKVERVTGGFRLTGGEGRFCSGIDHAHWLIVGSSVIGGADAQQPYFFVIPRAEIQIIDDWFTAGMRGTGSRSIRIPESFIPEHRAVRWQDMLTGNAPGSRFHHRPLYRMPFQDIAPFSLVGAPLGLARAAVRSFAEGLKASLARLAEDQVGAQAATYARLAIASAEIDAAYALVIEDATRIDEAASPESIGDAARARIPRNWAYAAQTARHAVNRVFEASGGSGIYESSELQRIWRDANAAAQHFAFTWDSAMANFGRVLVGLKPLSRGPGS
jgi:3-hydroxy-9,10-secoandrosta-1,3,5(10)-triene-9,17-dione monooxygenase